MGKFSKALELCEIKASMPKLVEPDLKNLKTMNEVWSVLKREYG